MKRTEHVEGTGRLRGDDGAALVEFALVGGLLFLLVFGIIHFGLVLSFKQDVTRAAAEGARAGAVTFPVGEDGELARQAAIDATHEAVDGFGKDCDSAGMTCNVLPVHDCDDTGGGAKCVTVELVYDYENHPLLVPLPLLSSFLPDEIRASSVVRINE